MSPVIETLYLRRPAIRYVSPPICPVFAISSASGSSSGGLMIEAASPLVAPVLRCVSGVLRWTPVSNTICVSLYRVLDNQYSLVSECIQAPGIVPPDFGCYAISVITLDGATPFSNTVCNCCEGVPPPCGRIIDTFEGYSDGQNLNGLNGGTCWGGPYVVRSVVVIYDTMEAYSDGQDLNGLNAGVGFMLPYVTKTIALDYDTMGSYSDGTDLSGLNGGVGFVQAYVRRNGSLPAVISDDMESYTDGAALNGLAGAVGWPGPYVGRP